MVVPTPNEGLTNGSGFELTSLLGAPTICSTGAYSANEPAVALIADSSPTPKVVTIAATPRSRA